jgi:hypothetical protein
MCRHGSRWSTSHPCTSDSGKSFWHFAGVVGADRGELGTAAAGSNQSSIRIQTHHSRATGTIASASTVSQAAGSVAQGEGLSSVAQCNPWLLSLAVTFLVASQVSNQGCDWGLTCCNWGSQNKVLGK